MIHLLLTFMLIFTAVDAKENIDVKIKKTSNKLSTFSKNYSNVNKKMAKTAKAILKQKRVIQKQQEYLKELVSELAKKEGSYKTKTDNLKKLKSSQISLKEKRDKLEEELVFVIAKSVTLSVILDEQYSVDSKSLIEFEVLKSMQKSSKAKANNLNKHFFTTTKDIEKLNKDTNSLEKEIAQIDAKRKDLLKRQKANKKALKKLEISKTAYKKELKNLIKKQDTLKKTLAKLNIIKIDKINKAKQEKERRLAFAAKGKISEKNLPKVKKHGSSYQSIKTKKYRGVKTIAPLDSYTITKKYGTYIDPIYGIKIFNESISLKPRKANAKVKTVFNGKVIYADETNVLKNIVIIEHKNGLHTIYANLSQISPNIKKGKKIKKGYTIGRVSSELIFEVTQKSYHINPIRLFK